MLTHVILISDARVNASSGREFASRQTVQTAQIGPRFARPRMHRFH